MLEDVLNIDRESIVNGLYGEKSQKNQDYFTCKTIKWGILFKNLSDEAQKIETFELVLEMDIETLLMAMEE